MANNKQIYVMFLCDEWKSVDSYRLYMVSTNDKKIKEEVRRLVQKGMEESEQVIRQFKLKFGSRSDELLKRF